MYQVDRSSRISMYQVDRTSWISMYQVDCIIDLYVSGRLYHGSLCIR